MLKGNDIHVADVQEIRRVFVRRQILFLDFKTRCVPIRIFFARTIYRYGKHWVSGNSVVTDSQVRSERGDATLAGGIIPGKCAVEVTAIAAWPGDKNGAGRWSESGFPRTDWWPTRPRRQIAASPGL